jgi:hypothetical protein
MADMYWNSEEVIHVDFLPHGITVKAQYYGNLLCNDVHQVSGRKTWESVKEECPTA